MRWDGLFADLEAQAAALAAAERSAEVEERTRVEAAQLGVIDRLRPSVGSQLRLRCEGGLVVFGQVRRVGSDWVLMGESSGREAVVSIAAVNAISGLGRLSAAPRSMGRVESRLGFRHVLRGIARDRSSVRIQSTDGSVVDGTIDRLGADFLELAVHAAGEWRRNTEVLDVQVIVLRAVAAVQRDAAG
ncbi:hypothetical protein ACSMXN_09900 [Jatrophihabitans sp. DSM 45814]